MNGSKSDLLLYAVTDRAWLFGESLAAQVAQVIEGGVTMVQLREKEASDKEFLAQAKEIRAITKQAEVPFIINDNIKIALACDADGVHVGQQDMDACEVRKKIGPAKLLGVSAQTVEQALMAEKSGADYLGVGAVFSTSTKANAKTVSFATLREICNAVSIPVVAIGGISEENVRKLADTGIAGIAVVSAVFAKKDKKKAANELFTTIKEMINQ